MGMAPPVSTEIPPARISYGQSSRRFNGNSFSSSFGISVGVPTIISAGFSTGFLSSKIQPGISSDVITVFHPGVPAKINP